MKVQRCKQGDTLLIEGTRVDGDGNPVSLAGVTVTSDILFGGTRVALTATVVNAAAGRFDLSLTAEQTEALAVGPWLCDVQFEDSTGGIVSSETFMLSVEADVTRAPD